MSQLRSLLVSAAVIVGGWMTTIPARADSPLRLSDVLGSVGRTHPQMEQAQLGIDKAEGKALAARGGFDPTLAIKSKWSPVGYYNSGQVDTLVRQATPAWGLGVFAGYRVGWGSYPSYKGDLETLSGGELRAGVDVPLVRNGPIDSRRAKIKKTKIGQIAAKRGRDSANLELQRDAARAYWTWVAAGLRLGVARDLLSIAERRDTGLKVQADAGAIERIKVVDNRRLVLDRQAKVVAAQQKFETAALKLSLFLRNDDREPVAPGEDRLPTALPTPVGLDVSALDDEVARALARRPELAEAQASRRAAAVDVRLARNQMAPEINVQSFVAKDLGRGPEELAPTEWGIGVVVAIPLPLRAARGEFRVAKAGLSAADAKLRGLRDKIGVEVRAAHVALTAAQRTVGLAREQVQTTETLAKAERTRFREGATDLLIVDLREIAAADAATKEIDALAQFQRARGDFLVSLGQSPNALTKAGAG